MTQWLAPEGEDFVYCDDEADRKRDEYLLEWIKRCPEVLETLNPESLRYIRALAMREHIDERVKNMMDLCEHLASVNREKLLNPDLTKSALERLKNNFLDYRMLFIGTDEEHKKNCKRYLEGFITSNELNFLITDELEIIRKEEKTDDQN